jgi:hypothetical protein
MPAVALVLYKKRHGKKKEHGIILFIPDINRKKGTAFGLQWAIRPTLVDLAHCCMPQYVYVAQKHSLRPFALY